MADGSKIEWTDATWNPITGCSVVSPGCTNCYAMRLAGTRMKDHPSRAGLTKASKAGPVWNGQVRLNQQWLNQPLHWRRPREIFVCAHADLFHDGVPAGWIDHIFAVMAMASHHRFQVLTKRSAIMRAYFADPAWIERVISKLEIVQPGPLWNGNAVQAKHELRTHGFLPNVWLGVSVEDQARANERIPDLLATPAAVRWLSAEPLLGPIDLTRVRRFAAGVADKEFVNAVGGRMWTDQSGLPNPDPRWAFPGMPFADGQRGIDWVVAGGESGPGSRPMHPDWARSLRDQCAEAGVAFHFKQWGDWISVIDRQQADPDWRRDYSNTYADRGEHQWLNLEGGRGFHGEGFNVMKRIGKKLAGRLLDGVQHDGMPA